MCKNLPVNGAREISWLGDMHKAVIPNSPDHIVSWCYATPLPLVVGITLLPAVWVDAGTFSSFVSSAIRTMSTVFSELHTY